MPNCSMWFKSYVKEYPSYYRLIAAITAAAAHAIMPIRLATDSISTATRSYEHFPYIS